LCNLQEIGAVLDQKPEVLAEDEEEEDDKPKEKKVSFERGAQHLDSSGRYVASETIPSAVRDDE